MKASDYKKLNQPLEHQVQGEVLAYLRSKGWYCMRLNSGKYSVGEGKSKRFIMGQDAGTPDVMALKACGHIKDHKMTHTLFIEVKRLGGVPTPLQMAKMEELRGYGSQVMVAHCVEDLQASEI